MALIDILDKKKRNPKDDGISFHVFTDLNLDVIIKEISSCFGEDVKRFYAAFPLDEECEKYRRDIYRDIAKTGLFEPLSGAYELMTQCNETAASSSVTMHRIQQVIIKLGEMYLYLQSVDALYKALSEREFEAEGLVNVTSAIKNYVTSKPYTDFHAQIFKYRQDIDTLRIRLDYENDRIRVSIADNPHSDSVSVPNSDSKIANPFYAYTHLESLEREILTVVADERPELLRALDSYVKKNDNFRNEQITLFFDQIAFYLSYMSFEQNMSRQGYTFCLPTISDDNQIFADGLYDLALAIANTKRKLPVIDNDFNYSDNEYFFVLTGPNQGGKTTFARSLGQLVFFSKMGLSVPAKHANIKYFHNLLTHFSVEESVETGRGKLMDELNRLAPMLSERYRNSFIVINELFTTAANYDACIMGRRVIKSFTDLDCHGIYVTHLNELLEGNDRAVGLCAILGDNGTATYKIRKSVVEYNNPAIECVEKYHLSYAELSTRLLKGGSAHEC